MFFVCMCVVAPSNFCGTKMAACPDFFLISVIGSSKGGCHVRLGDHMFVIARVQRSPIARRRPPIVADDLRNPESILDRTNGTPDCYV